MNSILYIYNNVDKINRPEILVTRSIMSVIGQIPDIIEMTHTNKITLLVIDYQENNHIPREDSIINEYGVDIYYVTNKEFENKSYIDILLQLIDIKKDLILQYNYIIYNDNNNIIREQEYFSHNLISLSKKLSQKMIIFKSNFSVERFLIGSLSRSQYFIDILELIKDILIREGDIFKLINIINEKIDNKEIIVSNGICWANHFNFVNYLLEYFTVKYGNSINYEDPIDINKYMILFLNFILEGYNSELIDIATHYKQNAETKYDGILNL